MAQHFFSMHVTNLYVLLLVFLGNSHRHVRAGEGHCCFVQKEEAKECIH
jgi:hypothetical protein